MRKGLMLLALLLCVTCTLSACTGLFPDDEPETIVQVCSHQDKNTLTVCTEYKDANSHYIFYTCPRCGMQGDKKAEGHVVDKDTGKCKCGAVLCTHENTENGVCKDCGAPTCEHNSKVWQTGYTYDDMTFHSIHGECADCHAPFVKDRSLHSLVYRTDPETGVTTCICDVCYTVIQQEE